jgi:hypothetical protein
MLSQLIYTSEVREDGLADGGVVTILEQARRCNAAASVTGLLVFDTNHFVQCLEGGREEVTATYQRIAVDPRHRDVTLICVTDVDERDFPDWTMGYLGVTAPARQVLLRFSPSGDFAPRSMSAASVTAMLKVLRSMDCGV